jgi:O-antigen ligase/polysaccharide polymerase Wzy-like membrane protein
VIIVRAMTNKLIAPLREAPATVPALAAVGLLVAWASDQAGYPVTHWGPGGLIVLALLGIAFGVAGIHAREIPLAVKVALACLAGYTGLSFLSILWAAVPGDAWEGANRTLLYLAVFALFVGWRQRGLSAALLLGLWTLAMVGLAAFVALHLNDATAAELQRLVPGGRLIYPTGYANANAALWLMAFWPALLLTRSTGLHWGIRGLLAGGAVLLADVALLSQSRGSLYATPLMLVLVFALLPRRLRTFAVLVPVAAAIGAAAPSVLRAGNHTVSGNVVPSTLHHAIAVSFAAALITALVVAAGAAIETRASFSQTSIERIRRGLTALALATLVLVLAGGLVAAGNPLTRIEHGWDTFKGGYAADRRTGSRLVSGLGSNRYDFYRVALDEFVAHPLVGIGADNFQQQYLRHRRSDDTPHYPHSLELRTLSQTGLLGALLALVGLGGALLAGARASRRAHGRPPDRLGADVAAAALAGFAYWAVHGSFDWFWEFSGLGATAFALLGIACALAPANGPSGAPAPAPRRSRAVRPIAVVGGVLVALAATASLAAPWLSQAEVESAARVWTTSPETAFARLDEAARLNPLSDEAYLVAGSIALRFGDLERADHEFSLALGRTPGDAYATLERGAIASTRGRGDQALRLLEAAARLNPRDELTRQALMLARQGKRVNVGELNRSILLKARQLA